MIQMTAAEHRPTTQTHPDIDLVGPLEACAMLVVDESELLEMVNGDRLSAYRLGGHIRFRAAELASLTGACL